MSHDTEEARFIIYYRQCGVEWEDIWSCACDSECPECGADIEPYDWEELEDLRERRRTPSIQASRFELQFIAKIAERASLMAQQHGIVYSHATALTDLNYCHANGCELRLDALLAAKDVDFAHDVFGIRDHLNRTTGALERGFVPRMALQQSTDEEVDLQS